MVCKLTYSESKCVFQSLKSQEALALLPVHEQGWDGCPSGMQRDRHPGGDAVLLQMALICAANYFKSVPSPLAISMAVSSESLGLLLSTAQSLPHSFPRLTVYFTS